MAIWQVSIELVPANWAEDHDFKTDLLYDEDGFDTTCSWVDNQPSVDLNSVLSKILPKSDSWSEGLTRWGSDEKHDIAVWNEGGKVCSVGFRLDLRENINSMALALCDAAIAINCMLFVPGHKVMFKPNIFQLKQFILKSDAAKFVEDPEDFLNDLSS